MGWRGSQNLSLRNFLVFRNLQQFILHNFTRGTDTLAALITNRHEFTKLLEGLGMVLAYRLPYFLSLIPLHKQTYMMTPVQFMHRV